MSSNTIHSANVGTMLAHRLRRWPSTVPTLAEHLVFAGICPTRPGARLNPHRLLTKAKKFSLRFLFSLTLGTCQVLVIFSQAARFKGLF